MGQAGACPAAARRTGTATCGPHHQDQKTFKITTLRSLRFQGIASWVGGLQRRQ
jgi:hypothetical protein